MATDDLRVLNYRFSSGVHSWNVFEQRDQYRQAIASIPGPETVDYVAQVDFICTCLRGTTDKLVCKHISAVVQYITRKTGGWEKDKRLMESAWAIMKMDKQFQVELIKKNRSAEFYKVTEDKSVVTVAKSLDEEFYRCERCMPSDGGYAVYGQDGCAHVEAVRAWERGTAGKQVDGDPLNEEAVKRWKLLVDQYNSPIEWDTAYSKSWSAAIQIPTNPEKPKRPPKPEKPKEPEKPKKPRNRFSEIDL